MGRMVFISNNPHYAGLSYPGLEAVLMEQGSSFDVLIAARNRIHQGWRLAHHPLYGNIRPRLQPFRSILLNEAETAGAVDLYSLDLISNAVAIYEEANEELSFPWSVPHSIKADCAFMDRELMRETLAQAGLPSRFTTS